MSKKIIFIWGFVITCLVLSIYVIGITKNEDLKYISKKVELKSIVKDYIKDNKINEFPLNINSKELIEKDYIDKITIDNKICDVDIKVNKKYIIYTYKMNFTCINDNEK